MTTVRPVQPQRIRLRGELLKRLNTAYLGAFDALPKAKTRHQERLEREAKEAAERVARGPEPVKLKVKAEPNRLECQFPTSAIIHCRDCGQPIVISRIDPTESRRCVWCKTRQAPATSNPLRPVVRRPEVALAVASSLAVAIGGDRP
jgi:hypothetical protein